MKEQTRSRELAYIENAHEEIYPGEAEKRKERRHAQASREREGERRRREGVPWNYLLIDRHKKIPYGMECVPGERSCRSYQRSLTQP